MGGFDLCICQLCFITNTKVTNGENTAGHLANSCGSSGSCWSCRFCGSGGSRRLGVSAWLGGSGWFFFFVFDLIQKHFQMEILSLMIQKNLTIPKSLIV